MGEDVLDLSGLAEEELIRAACLGEREAFEVLVHRHGPALHRYARQLLDSDADVADAVQETFIAAWRRLCTFKGTSSLRTWLFSICSNKVVDTYRAKRAQPIDDQLLEAMPGGGALEDPFAAVSNAEFLSALDRALAELPVRQRATWVMREVEDMSFVDIGEVLRLSPDAARGHYHRAASTLRLRLGRWRQ